MGLKQIKQAQYQKAWLKRQTCCRILHLGRAVAQSGSASVSGSEGRKFESCQPDQLTLCPFLHASLHRKIGDADEGLFVVGVGHIGQGCNCSIGSFLSTRRRVLERTG